MVLLLLSRIKAIVVSCKFNLWSYCFSCFTIGTLNTRRVVSIINVIETTKLRESSHENNTFGGPKAKQYKFSLKYNRWIILLRILTYMIVLHIIYKRDIYMHMGRPN